MEVCPVCQTEVVTEGPEETDYRDEEMQTPQVTHEGMTYYFCCEECKATFEDAPEQYA